MSDDPNHVGDVFAYQSIDRATMRLIEEWRNLMVTDRDAVIDRLGFTHMPADVTAAARIAIELLEKLGYE